MEKENKDYDCFSVEEKDFLNYLRRGRAERKNSVYMICLPHLQNDSLAEKLIKNNLDHPLRFTSTEGTGKSRIVNSAFHDYCKSEFYDSYEKKKHKLLKYQSDDKIRHIIARTPKYVYSFFIIGLIFFLVADLFKSFFIFGFGLMYILTAFILAQDVTLHKLMLEIRRK